jgi:hypothetical protein
LARLIEIATSLPAMSLTSKALSAIDHNRLAADGANLERHRETFDPGAVLGGGDIWIALKEASGA